MFLAAIVATGTLGYMFIEGWSFGDAIYMTVISISTTGFREVRELSPMGRLLTVLVIVTGIAAVAYVAGRVLQIAVESYLLRRGRMNRNIARLRDHVILCGFGRMGRHIADDLHRAKVAFVIVERDPERTAELEETGYRFLIGDASSDEVLTQAGVERARGLIAVVATDAENVYTTLTARSLNKSISVVARALTEESEPKLRTAGADRVIKPYELVARRIAQLVIRPSMVEFVDTVARSDNAEITLEEIALSPESGLVGVRLGDTAIRRDLNVIVVAIRRGDEALVYNPGAAEVFQGEDHLIAIGRTEQLAKLRGLCGTAKAR